MGYEDLNIIAGNSIFTIGVINAAVFYLVYPIYLIIRKRELSKKKICQLTIWNSIVVFVLFTFLHLITDGEPANSTAAVTCFFVSGWMLKKFCLTRTEESKMKSTYGKLYNQLLVDSVGLYMINKVANDPMYDKEMLEQLKDGLLQKYKQEKGTRYVKKLKSFFEEVNWEVFAKEINLDERIERGEFNPHNQEDTDIKSKSKEENLLHKDLIMEPEWYEDEKREEYIEAKSSTHAESISNCDTLNCSEKSIIIEDIASSKNVKSKTKNRKWLKKVIISLILIVCLSAGTIFAGVLILNKIDSYDLTTSTYPQYHVFGGVYVYNEEVTKSEAVRDSMFFDTTRNIYINIFSTDILYQIQMIGLYEEIDGGLYTKDIEGNIKEYIRYGGTLIEKNSFYVGDVPKRDKFDAVFTFKSSDGSTRELMFRKNGTYTGLSGETGTYIRDGYKIIGVSIDSAMPRTEWIVYDGKLTHNFYQFSWKTSNNDRVEYEYYIFLRDYLEVDLTNSEKIFVTQYEKEHPISTIQQNAGFETD